MRTITAWVHRNLEATEQKIIARDGLDVCETTYQLINNSDKVCKTYLDHAASIWMMLDEKAEQYGSRPLQILDEYGMKGDRWPCSHESFCEVALLWAIEQQCKENCPDWDWRNRLRVAA
ncbi:MAG: hypothetical protein CL844_04980 [Crocinitomicaceae bacterium]|nr:hypothetical protein [Crocinitomicaceae bacterium]|tara:strand:+ start:9455 stop:9811 length:357 start_codon:yes stop_codon:yes gene_type:complete